MNLSFWSHFSPKLTQSMHLRVCQGCKNSSRMPNADAALDSCSKYVPVVVAGVMQHYWLCQRTLKLRKLLLHAASLTCCLWLQGRRTAGQALQQA